MVQAEKADLGKSFHLPAKAAPAASLDNHQYCGSSKL
jgi:hypothetical protein